MKKVKIIITYSRDVIPEFSPAFQSVQSVLSVKQNDIAYSYEYAIGLWCDVGRSVLAGKLDFDYAYIADADNWFSHDLIMRLLSQNKAIISAKYRRRGTNEMCAGLYYGSVENFPMDYVGFHKAHWSGAGALLVKREVFDKLEQPYFAREIIPGRPEQLGGDIYFCQKAIKAGFDIWIDCDIESKHDTEWWQYYKQIIKGDIVSSEQKQNSFDLDSVIAKAKMDIDSTVSHLIHNVILGVLKPQLLAMQKKIEELEKQVAESKKVE